MLKGSNHSDNTRKKISEAHKGKKRKFFTQETKRKMSLARFKLKERQGFLNSEESRIKMRRPCSEETKIKIGLSNTGKKRSEETRNKISETHKKERHPNWKGGISENPYPKEFNKELKQKIRERDNFTCCLCGRTEREELEEFNRVLAVNHIDFDKNNCKEANLNTLCLRCNVKINRDRDYWIDYFKGK